MEAIILHHYPEQTRLYDQAYQQRAAQIKNLSKKEREAFPKPAMLIDQRIPKRITFAVKQMEDGVFLVSYSACAWGDNFEKKEGRAKALARIRDERYPENPKLTEFTFPPDDVQFTTMSERLSFIERHIIPAVMLQFKERRTRSIIRKTKVEQ